MALVMDKKPNFCPCVFVFVFVFVERTRLCSNHLRVVSGGASRGPGPGKLIVDYGAMIVLTQTCRHHSSLYNQQPCPSLRCTRPDREGGFKKGRLKIVREKELTKNFGETHLHSAAHTAVP